MKIMRVILLFLMLIGLTLGGSTLAKAGGGHHHHHHDHYYDEYIITYSQPPNYYGLPYYPQPQLSHNYYPTPVPVVPVPVPVPAPVPVYAPVVTYPPSVILGIDTGNTSFMFSY